VEDKAVYPKPKRTIALGLLAGLGLGVAAAFLAERLDPVFHSLDEIKEKTDLPLLGVIPLQKDLNAVEQVIELSLPRLQIGNYQLGSSSSDSLVLDRPSSSSDRGSYRVSGFLEAFRSLNTNIWLLGSETDLKSFVVSSASPGDGKSTVAVNLAQAAAAMGQRVLIVDADLRRPQVHRRLNIANEQGLSNVLATGLSLEEAIQPVSQWENLSVLTAGDIPPDPTRLLASRKMQQIMDQLRQQDAFDIVIYDTPPLANFADARILGALTNGIVMVIRMGKTDRSTVKHTLDDLKMANVPMLGLVTNAVQRGGLGGYHNYYYYYGKK
jgi:capsular exopolysaccharide synthesis family protein